MGFIIIHGASGNEEVSFGGLCEMIQGAFQISRIIAGKVHYIIPSLR